MKTQVGKLRVIPCLRYADPQPPQKWPIKTCKNIFIQIGAEKKNVRGLPAPVTPRLRGGLRPQAPDPFVLNPT